MTTTTPAAATQPHELELALERIQVGDLNMRSGLSNGELAELAASMSAVGLINAIQVIDHGQHFELVAGHRRCAAAELLGWSTIRARVIQPDRLQAWSIAWAENSAREGVTVIDQARWIAAMMQSSGANQSATAQTLNISASHLSALLATLEYPEHVQESVSSGAVTHGVARALMRIPNDGIRDYYLAQAVEFGCTVRTAEEWTRNYLASEQVTDPNAPAPGPSENGDVQQTSYLTTCHACHNPLGLRRILITCCPDCADLITRGSQ